VLTMLAQERLLLLILGRIGVKQPFKGGGRTIEQICQVGLHPAYNVAQTAFEEKPVTLKTVQYPYAPSTYAKEDMRHC
jgi:hypothetical protein